MSEGTEAEVARERSPASSGRRSSVWPVAAWLLVVATGVVLGVAVYGRVLAHSLVLDLVSFWPGLLLAVLVVAALWPLLRRGGARLGAILPLLLLTWAWGCVALHFAEWDLLPSSRADLAGPVPGPVEFATLTLSVDGPVALIGGESLLYEVRPERRGGPVGVPEAVERLEQNRATVALFEAPPGSWFANAGWRISMADSPRWLIEVEARHVSMDLRTMALERLGVKASGSVRLPAPVGEIPIVLDGDLVVEVPAATGVVVVGAARVPEGWEVTETGWRSPGRTPGYQITVTEGSDIRIRER